MDSCCHFIHFKLLFYFKLALLCSCFGCLSSIKIAIVTGANKGIGYETAKKISYSGVKTILACRSEHLGKGAEASLKSLGLDVHFMLVDVSDPASIFSFVEEFNHKLGKLDILVNNAAMTFHKGDPTPYSAQARPTMQTNYFGVVTMTNLLLPLIRESSEGVILNVASETGHLNIIKKNATLKSAFSSNTLTIPKLNNLVHSYISDVEAGVHIEKGWPKHIYGVSKLAVIAATKVWARDDANRNILISTGCPGHCDTDLSAHLGKRTPAEGANILFHILNLPQNTTSGGFYANYKQIEW